MIEISFLKANRDKNNFNVTQNIIIIETDGKNTQTVEQQLFRASVGTKHRLVMYIHAHTSQHDKECFRDLSRYIPLKMIFLQE